MSGKRWFVLGLIVPLLFGVGLTVNNKLALLVFSDTDAVVVDAAGKATVRTGTGRWSYFDVVAGVEKSISVPAIELAQSTATTGVNNAATAQGTANTALANAATAEANAQTGITNAATAQGTANTGVTNAATAQGTANTALVNAATAEADAQTGITNAATAQGAADSHAARHLTAGGDTIASATALAAGLATSAQIAKLDGIAAGADVTGANPPQAHAASHVAGDAIQSATAAQVGLMTTAYAGKLDGIEAGADVTDATNVTAAGALMSGGGNLTGSVTCDGGVTLDGVDVGVAVPAAQADATTALAGLTPTALLDADFACAAGHLRKTGAGAYVCDVDFVTAIVAPTVNEDSTLGFGSGSLWRDTVGGADYLCLSGAVGAAIWTPLGGADTTGLTGTTALSYTVNNAAAAAPDADPALCLLGGDGAEIVRTCLRQDSSGNGINVHSALAGLADGVSDRTSSWTIGPTVASAAAAEASLLLAYQTAAGAIVSQIALTTASSADMLSVGTSTWDTVRLVYAGTGGTAFQFTEGGTLKAHVDASNEIFVWSTYKDRHNNDIRTDYGTTSQCYRVYDSAFGILKDVCTTASAAYQLDTSPSNGDVTITHGGDLRFYEDTDTSNEWLEYENSTNSIGLGSVSGKTQPTRDFRVRDGVPFCWGSDGADATAPPNQVTVDTCARFVGATNDFLLENAQDTGDIQIRLGETAGATSLICEDSTGADMWSVNSDGNMTITGGLTQTVRSETATAATQPDDETDCVVTFDPTLAQAYTLDDASGQIGAVLELIQLDAVLATTITPNTGDTISGSATYSLNTQYESVTIRAVSANLWVVVAATGAP